MTALETTPPDLAADIGRLLASDATFDGRTLQARDIAVIVETHRDARDMDKPSDHVPVVVELDLEA